MGLGSSQRSRGASDYQLLGKERHLYMSLQETVEDIPCSNLQVSTVRKLVMETR
jgi:hypothetical protein